MSSEPKRLLESGDTELGRSLGAAREHLPSPERLAAIGERLAQLGLPATEGSGVKPTPEAAGAPPAPASSPWLLKGVAGALVSGGVVLTLALTLPGKETVPTEVPASLPPAAAASSAPAPEPSASLPPRSERRPLAAPRASASHTEARAEPPSAPPPSLPEPRPLAERATTPRSVTDPRAAARMPERAPAVATETPPPAVAPATTAEANAGPGELRRGTAPSEVELLKEARRALSGEPERALQLTRRYGAEYPHGTYAQERDFIAISALSRLGRSTEARSRADAFRARYPRSAYLPQLERLLGGR